jgi:hypothetical protein
VAAALTGLASLGAARAAFASPSAPRVHDRAQVLRLRAVFVNGALNSAGHGGPGDVQALLLDVRTLSGAKVGKETVSCTVMPQHQSLCHSAFVLHGGQIDAMASVSDTATRFTAAIIGGTGIYDGVTGQIRNLESPPGVFKLRFQIIRPDRR